MQSQIHDGHTEKILFIQDTNKRMPKSLSTNHTTQFIKNNRVGFTYL